MRRIIGRLPEHVDAMEPITMGGEEVVGWVEWVLDDGEYQVVAFNAHAEEVREWMQGRIVWPARNATGTPGSSPSTTDEPGAAPTT